MLSTAAAGGWAWRPAVAVGQDREKVGQLHVIGSLNLVICNETEQNIINESSLLHHLLEMNAYMCSSSVSIVVNR